MLVLIIVALLIYYYFKANVINESNNIQKNNDFITYQKKEEDSLIYSSSETASFQSETLIVNTSFAENSKWFFFPLPGEFEAFNDNYQLSFTIKERECQTQENNIILKKYISNIKINNIELKKVNITNTDSAVIAVNLMLSIINPNNDYIDTDQDFVLSLLIEMSATIIYFNDPDNNISCNLLISYMKNNKPKYYSVTNGIFKEIEKNNNNIINTLSSSEYTNEKVSTENIDIYFQILGFNSSNGVSSSDVKNAYKKLSIKYHPDNKDTGDSDQFKLITNAYNFLKNY